MQANSALTQEIVGSSHRRQDHFQGREWTHCTQWLWLGPRPQYWENMGCGFLYSHSVWLWKFGAPFIAGARAHRGAESLRESALHWRWCAHAVNSPYALNQLIFPGTDKGRDCEHTSQHHHPLILLIMARCTPMCHSGLSSSPTNGAQNSLAPQGTRPWHTSVRLRHSTKPQGHISQNKAFNQKIKKLKTPKGQSSKQSSRCIKIINIQTQETWVRQHDSPRETQKSIHTGL